jgi:hypothetical protein
MTGGGPQSQEVADRVFYEESKLNLCGSATVIDGGLLLPTILDI